MKAWLLYFVSLAGALSAQQMRVAAAADLAPGMNELKHVFEAKHPGSTVTVSIGSSVQLEQQVASGAPFDVFLSADMEQPQKLIAAGSADQDSLFEYAQGILMLMVPQSRADIIDLQRLALSDGKVAIANPAHAPYGRAAVAALQSAKVYERLQPRLVQAENIAQTAQYVISGNAMAGLVSASAKGAAGTQFTLHPVDPQLYPAIRQGAVLTKSGAQNAVARQFLMFLHTPEAQRILQAHGLKTGTATLKPPTP